MGFFDGLKRAYGQADKHAFLGILPGGAQVNSKLGGYTLAAGEAIPAITQGALHLGDRTDRHVDKRMTDALIEAEATARARGSDVTQYKDYPDTPGGVGAAHVFGDVSMSGFKRDAAGKVIGIKPHKYDTDKSVKELQAEILAGGPLYKPADLALAAVQDHGMTSHDLDFGTQSKPTASPVASQPVVPIVPQNKATPAPAITSFSPTTPPPIIPRTQPTAPPVITQTAPRPAGVALAERPELTTLGPLTGYSVKAGDTLTAIAAANNTTIDDIARKNKIDNVDLINIGQKLIF